MTTTIRKLHAVGAEVDPLLIRLRLERALGAADLRPPGMPPAAILCVRRLPDPLPGRLSLDTLAPPRGWEEAMRAALGRMAQRAARPARGAPPPDAPAVRFEDRAELLACLARDWCAGALAGRWWWRALLRDPGAHAADLTGRLYAAWRATPEAAPAALALLHDSGDGARFLALLPSAEVRALTRSVAATFGLPVLDRTRALPPVHQGHVAPPAAAAALAVLDTAADVGALDPERRALYAAGVLLARAPMLARAVWPVVIERWAYDQIPDTHAGHQQSLLESPAVGPPPLPNSAQLPRRYAAEQAPERVRSALLDAANDMAADVASAPAILPDAAAPADARLSEIAPSDPGATAAPRAGASARTFGPLAQALRPAEGLETRVGGLLFLLNLALHLDLYGDFTRPLHAGIGLSPWALLALLGPHLLPDAIPDDPLWALLAGLAGDEPGAGFTPPRRWRAPRAWLAPFGMRGSRRIAHRAGWLQLVHPAGFVVLEQFWPLSHRTAEPANHETEEQRVTRAARARRPLWRNGSIHRLQLARALPFDNPPDTLNGWIERLAGYTRARLALALGGEAEVARALALPARMYASDVGFDTVFSLNGLPIAVRLAGLDRDPGWVPAAGRDIRFHFE